MNFVIFIITLATEIIVTLFVAFSVFYPNQRIWPPNDRRVWGKSMMIILFNLIAGGDILLGILDWNSSIIPTWARIVVGLPFWLTGNILAAWAVIALGLVRTSGQADALIRRGPYRFSRNPQYLGFMLGLVGWAVLANSTLTIITGLAAFPSLILVPFAEEPWLLARYGPVYEMYKRETPRFFALKWGDF